MIKLSKQEIENAPDFMPVVGYEGLYEVGKDGSVWSLNYQRTGQRKQMTPTPCDKYGHLKVGLWKEGKRKTCGVHQLVLNAYLPKPSEDLEVLHKNSKPSDNRLENLEWGTHMQNMNDPRFKASMSENMTNRKDQSTPVVCLETGVVYPSTNEAERRTGVYHSSISSCINGKCKTAGGFHWQKVDEYQ